MDTIPFGEQRIPVICETDDVIAVDKPVGLSSIPERNPRAVSLLNLLSQYRQRKLYVVHRLDKQVSGVILFAKTPEFHRYLNLQFERRRVLKTYLALVHGQVPAGGRIETPLRRFGSGRMAADHEEGKPCVTVYEILEHRPEATLLRVQPLTGRKHQIRAHLCGIGHPIIGDPLYGDKRIQRTFPRLMLHAASIEFRLPDDRRFSARTPVPPGFMLAA
jgi:tRNA pseudouridine32 synthase / 23S rRNA pseudouridine746 synthase